MHKIFNYNYDILFDKCKEVLKELDIRIDSIDKKEGLIEASTASSILSWGEEISIKFQQVGNKQIKILVKSVSSAQLIDWGKNSKNEESILNKLLHKLQG